jgi:hypothetical protein
MRPVPSFPGLVVAALGLGGSLALVRETQLHAEYEASLTPWAPSPQVMRRGARNETETASPTFVQIVRLTSWTDKALRAASQAGMVNNPNDALVWGLVPIVLADARLPHLFSGWG